MELIFVYNAKSGLKQSIFDVGHKLLNPKTYPCSLCALTYSTFRETKTWKTFRVASKADMVFYHSDEFENNFPNTNYKYPIILKKSKNDLSVVLTSDDLNTIENVEQLIAQLECFTNPIP